MMVTNSSKHQSSLQESITHWTLTWNSTKPRWTELPKNENFWVLRLKLLSSLTTTEGRWTVIYTPSNEFHRKGKGFEKSERKITIKSQYNSYAKSARTKILLGIFSDLKVITKHRSYLLKNLKVTILPQHWFFTNLPDIQMRERCWIRNTDSSTLHILYAFITYRVKKQSCAFAIILCSKLKPYKVMRCRTKEIK